MALHQERYDLLLSRLIDAREEMRLSQRDVCERMGMPHSFLSKCETGDRRIDVMEFMQLAQVYGKTLDFFVD